MITFLSGRLQVQLTEAPLSLRYSGVFQLSFEDEHDSTYASRDALDYLINQFPPQPLRFEVEDLAYDHWGASRLRNIVKMLNTKGYAVTFVSSLDVAPPPPLQKTVLTPARQRKTQKAGRVAAMIAVLVAAGILIRKMDPLILHLGVLYMSAQHIMNITGLSRHAPENGPPQVKELRAEPPGRFPLPNLISEGLPLRCVPDLIFHADPISHIHVQVKPVLPMDQTGRNALALEIRSRVSRTFGNQLDIRVEFSDLKPRPYLQQEAE